MSKILELAKKLKALADRGIDGEKDNAVDALNRLLKKHNISLQELEEEKIITKVFKVGRHKQLFVQCSASISDSIKLFGHRHSKVKMIVDLTTSQFIELEAKFEFYKKDYEKKERQFFDAYIQSNRLFGEGKLDASKLTEEEIAEIRETLRLSQAIKKAEYFKQLKR